MVKHKYKIGDKVEVVEKDHKCARYSNERYIQPGDVLTITKISDNKKIFYFNNMDNCQFGYVLEFVIPYVEQQQCTCPSQDLFNYGCKCGFLK